MHIPSICALCFSKDRSLISITSKELDFFYVLFPENREFMQSFHSSSPLRVCFECKGRLKNVQKFIVMAQQSIRTLIKYSHSSNLTALTCSSTLTRSKISVESIVSVEVEIDVEHINDGIKLEAPEYEDSTYGDIAGDMKVKNDVEIAEISTDVTAHGPEQIFSMPLLSCIRKKTVKAKEKSAKKNIKAESNSEAEDNFDSSIVDNDGYISDTPSSSPRKQNVKQKLKKTKEKPHIETKEKMPRTRRKKSQMWYLLQTLWVAKGQATSWYKQELEKERCVENTEQCDKCSKGFKGKDELKFHVLWHHEALGATWECDICNYKFTKQIHMHRHVRDHYSIYKCKECNYESRSLNDMKGHTNGHEYENADDLKKIKTTVPEDFPHWCKKCKTYFAVKSQMQTHATQYGCHGPSARCDDCLQLFSNQDKYMHSCTFQQECKDCHQKFKSLYFKRAHICPNKAEVKDSTYYCVECDKHFACSSHYRNHISKSLKHNNRDEFKHGCPHCSRKFNSLKYLQGHIAKVHFKVGEFKCCECGKCYTTKRRLRTHVARHHEMTYVQVKDKICHVCGRAFELQCNLRNHIRTHTGERPFKCDICGDTFRQQTSLWSHNKVIHLKQKLKSQLRPRKKYPKKRKELTAVPADDMTPTRHGKDIFARFVSSYEVAKLSQANLPNSGA